MDWDEMSNHNRGLSIDASYQVSFIWPNGFRGEESNFFNSFLFFTGVIIHDLKENYICIVPL
jgi:hypothetical protein